MVSSGKHYTVVETQSDELLVLNINDWCGVKGQGSIRGE